jgi:tyrosine-protein kinase Etk/Wzc
MSDELVRPGHSIAPYGEAQIQPWQDQGPAFAGMPHSPLERPLAAVRRYKWIILAIVILSTGGGIAATRFMKPEYEVRASILISSDSPMQERTGPIRSPGLLNADDWIALLKSAIISDAVVRKLTLYLEPDKPADRDAFQGFTLAERYVPGQYELSIDPVARHWTLSLKTASMTESGTAADSIGRKFGFLWKNDSLFAHRAAARTVGFTVSTPRETAGRLIDRLNTRRQEQSDFVLITFSDRDRDLAASIVNQWLREFIAVAADLKKRKLSEFSATLNGQLQQFKSTLDAAESQLQTFRVNTITLPTESGHGPIAAGVEQTMDPVMRDYVNRKIEYDNIRNDIQVLREMLRSVAKDSMPSDALLQIPSVAQGGVAASALQAAFKEYHESESKLSTARVVLTDEHPQVKGFLENMREIKEVKIPRYANELLVGLLSREKDDSARIAGADVNLKQIPQRTIDEERLRRNRDVAATLYTNLQSRYAEAQLAEASATPDVRILDTAIAPLAPAKNTATRLMLMAIIGGIGAAFGLAILLDRIDPKLRYPEQATDELGLLIAGTVPRFPKDGPSSKSPEQMFQLVESFRTLRMSVRHASRPPIAFAVSSPSPGEGKSFISANLAMSFADAGMRTVLVDGDTRRGAIHQMFGLRASPGLTEYLSGKAGRSDIVLNTTQRNLSVISCGARLRRSPELLISARLGELVAQLRSDFEVVIFDTPPLAAGIDGYSIATATGSLLLVMRIGTSNRRLASEKLRMFERLPVGILGAVLNAVQFQGAYEYYGYVPGYEASDEPPGTEVVEVT